MHAYCDSVAASGIMAKLLWKVVKHSFNITALGSAIRDLSSGSAVIERHSGKRVPHKKSRIPEISTA